MLDLLWSMLLNITNLVGLSLKDLWEGIQGAEVVNLVENFGASLKLSRWTSNGMTWRGGVKM